MMLEAQDLRLGFAGKVVIDRLSLRLPAGQMTAIIGPNGCGKSTLLRGLARLLRPMAGRVLLEGCDINALPTRQVARRLALLPQSPIAPEGISVADLVARGRAPWRGPFGLGPADRDAVAHALAVTGLAAHGARPLSALSGGQRQRAWIAMALAQDTPLLLLDEPTTWLDLPHQVELLSLLQRLRAGRGRTVVTVLHDLGLAARFADHVVVVAGGAILAEGPPAEVVTPDTLRAAFGLEAVVIPDPVAGTPLVVPK
ncbi:ABC transporter ATP-binding protein [Halodurantibacterium flavum]|uniref:ABC transporter ATP-binding protein n=1 Tax=Halodurantibacterium flavum TaxID=1382802 RepID=A0ABW4S726_9RHOB